MGGMQLEWGWLKIRPIRFQSRWRKIPVRSFGNLFLKIVTEGAVTTETRGLIPIFHNCYEGQLSGEPCRGPEWLNRVLHQRALSNLVQKGMLHSAARQDHQDQNTSYSPREICGWRGQGPSQLPRRPFDRYNMTDGVGNQVDRVKLLCFTQRGEKNFFQDPFNYFACQRSHTYGCW